MKQNLKRIEESGDEDLFESDSNSTENEASGDNAKNQILINNFFHRHQLLNVGEVGHVESVWRRVLGPGSGKLSVHIPEGECGGVSSTAAILSTKIGMLVRGLIPISVNKWVDVPTEVKEYIMDRVLDHFDLDYTRHEDVRTVVETMMTARRTHRNRMHAYFKKFPSKEAALLKPHPDTTEEQWKELCDLFTSEAFMKRSEQNKKNRSKLTVNHAAGSRSFQRTRACMKNQESGNINPAELYKKNYTNKDGIWTSEGAREIYERMDAFQRKCDLEGKTYTEIEVYSEILGKKSGYVRGLGRAVKPLPSSTLTTQSSDLQHQLAKARMR
ncbi:hypothetical protein CJ030_MR8G023485 [Morella rubra]|uniref:Uncharacterized protein n=1 Tax=Morella rubra TaxID=262757 RepID=A0A6A1USE3_9ROSI|nr:hypothetical protein CJ030_MR8G023485 [Morella rubra]